MDWSKYENKLPYPKRPRRFSAKGLAEMRAILGEEKAQEAIAVSDKRQRAWEAACAEYGAEESRLRELFYSDLCTEHGVPYPSKFADALLAHAWEDGHSGGLSEVAIQFISALDLVESVDKARAEDGNGSAEVCE